MAKGEIQSTIQTICVILIVPVMGWMALSLSKLETTTAVIASNLDTVLKKQDDFEGRIRALERDK